MPWMLNPTFYASDDDLTVIDKQVPKAPLYLARDQRGGVLVRRWNLIVPDELVMGREPDEPQR